MRCGGGVPSSQPRIFLSFFFCAAVFSFNSRRRQNKKETRKLDQSFLPAAEGVVAELHRPFRKRLAIISTRNTAVCVARVECGASGAAARTSRTERMLVGVDMSSTIGSQAPSGTPGCKGAGGSPTGLLLVCGCLQSRRGLKLRTLCSVLDCVGLPAWQRSRSVFCRGVACGGKYETRKKKNTGGFSGLARAKHQRSSASLLTGPSPLLLRRRHDAFLRREAAHPRHAR